MGDDVHKEKWSLILKRFNKRDLSLIGCVIVVVSHALILLNPMSFGWVLAMTIIRSLGQAPLTSVVFGMMGDVVEYGQWKSHIRQESLIFACGSLGFKIGTGVTSAVMTAMLEGLGVDALGLNCSLGPGEMKKIVPELYKYSSLPIIVKPNAGIPRSEKGETVYDVLPEDFAREMAEIAEMGAVILGGCCGTTPEYIKALKEKTENLKPLEITEKNITLVSSYTHAAEIGRKPLIIGERINPTGKKLFKQALRDHNIDYILNEGLEQQEKKCHILDVNVGLPEIDEEKLLSETREQGRKKELLQKPLQDISGYFS